MAMKQKLIDIRDEVERWTRQPGAELTRKQRAARYWFDLCRHCFAELKYDKAGQMAAALTYHTLFSLLPTIVLMLVVLQAFVGPEEQERFKTQAVDWLLEPIAHDAGAPEPVASEPPAPGDAGQPNANEGDAGQLSIEAERRREFNEARQAIEEQIESVIDKLGRVSFGGIGVIGLLIFIYGATGLLTTIEKSFNHIYNAARMRPIYLRFPLYFTIIVLGPIVILAGQVAQRWFIDILRVGGSWTDWLAGPMVLITPLVTLVVVLGAVYKWMPNTRVTFRASFVGAVAAALLLVAAIEGLKLYTANAATSTVYGAMFLLPLILLFFWVTWMLILFGLEVAHALQAMKGKRFKHLAARQDEMVIDPTWLVPLVAEIADRFERGETATVEKLADRMNLTPRATQRMLNALEQANMVHRVGGDDDRAAGYVLARPADRMNAADIMAVGERMTADVKHRDTAAWTLIGRLRDQWKQTAEQTRIKDLAGDSSLKPSSTE